MLQESCRDTYQEPDLVCVSVVMGIPLLRALLQVLLGCRCGGGRGEGKVRLTLQVVAAHTVCCLDRVFRVLQTVCHSSPPTSCCESEHTTAASSAAVAGCAAGV